MQISGWEYIYDTNGNMIIPKYPIVIPDYFVKYYGLSEHSVEALTKSYFYFSHPLIINDPFDSCRQIINLSKFSERQFVKLIYKNLKFTSPKFNRTLDEVKSMVGDMYRIDKAELIDMSLTFYWNILFKDWGIFSLSGIEDNILLWSYYTNHTGFAIKLKNEIFENKDISGPFPINYSDSYETIFPRSISIEKEYLLYLTNIKSNQWIHEKEWRFIVNRDNMSIPGYFDNSLQNNKRNIDYNFDKIDSIILGHKFFQDNFTDQFIGKNKDVYRFNQSVNTNDVLKTKVLNFILDHKLRVKQIETKENNKFELIAIDISINCKENGKEYIVEKI